MGLFEKKECCICGGKAGMMTRQKLADKSFICGDCVSKCSPNLHMDDYERMTRMDVLDCMRFKEENTELYKKQFQETDAVKIGIFGGTKILSVDGRKGWWVVGNQARPDVFGFDEVANWQLMLDTTEKSEDERREGKRPVMPPRYDLPVCRPDENITKMYVRVMLRHPFISYVDIVVMNAILVTDNDIEDGYKAALEVYSLFERFSYQQGYAPQQGYSSHQHYGSQQGYAPYQHYAAQQGYTTTNQNYAPQQNYSHTRPQGNAAAASDSIRAAEELKRYKELLDMGAITEKEYNAKKRQLLGI